MGVGVGVGVWGGGGLHEETGVGLAQGWQRSYSCQHCGRGWDLQTVVTFGVPTWFLSLLSSPSSPARLSFVCFFLPLFLSFLSFFPSFFRVGVRVWP